MKDEEVMGTVVKCVHLVSLNTCSALQVELPAYWLCRTHVVMVAVATLYAVDVLKALGVRPPTPQITLESGGTNVLYQGWRSSVVLVSQSVPGHILPSADMAHSENLS